MSIKRIQVIMFGWEFPPNVSGGLGVATLGLCKSLANLVDLTMVIPKNVKDFYIPHIRLIGLNTFTQDTLNNLFENKSGKWMSIDQDKLEFPIDPYHLNDDREYANEKFQQVFESGVEPFDIEELYKGDVISNVLKFARISYQYGLTQDFDVIHAHDWMTFLPAMELKKKTGKPLVLHVHSTEFDRNGKSAKNWVFDLEQKAMQFADVVIPVSNYTGEVIQKYYGINPVKIYPIHNGISPITKQLGSSPFAEKLVIFFGRITYQKGPEYFIEAANLVSKHYPNVKFVMAGSGNLFHEMVEKVAQLNLGNRFFFTGHLSRQKLNELLAIADVYCMPSVSEPFGLSAVEAAQYGIPTIISKSSGVGEVLKGSFVVDYDNVNQLAEYIIAALRFDHVKEIMVEANNESLKHISWEACAKKVYEIYCNLLSK